MGNIGNLSRTIFSYRYHQEWFDKTTLLHVLHCQETCVTLSMSRKAFHDSGTMGIARNRGPFWGDLKNKKPEGCIPQKRRPERERENSEKSDMEHAILFLLFGSSCARANPTSLFVAFLLAHLSRCLVISISQDSILRVGSSLIIFGSQTAQKPAYSLYA